jgi:hypothetical protein
MIGEIYAQLYTTSKELRDAKTLLKQKDEEIALLRAKLKAAEKPKEDIGGARVSDK